MIMQTLTCQKKYFDYLSVLLFILSLSTSNDVTEDFSRMIHSGKKFKALDQDRHACWS